MSPVEEQTATLFTTLPEELRYRGEPTAWMTAVRPGTRLGSFLEGPSFDRDGNLYVTDVPHGRIFRITPAGRWEVVVEYGGQPSGLAIHRDGRLFVADAQRGIVAIDPGGHRVRSVCTEYAGESFAGCSDLVFTADGDLFFTDAGHSSLRDPSGRLFRLSAGGRLDLLVSNIAYPNGLAINQPEAELFVAVTRGNAVWKLAPDAPGPLMVGLFVQLSGGLGPDGLAVDAGGRLAVAHARSGSVWIFDASGEAVGRIRTPTGRGVTNVAYGGPDHRALYITEADSGSVLRAELDVPGQPLFSHH